MPIVGMEDCTVVGSDEESRRSLLDSGSSAPSSRTVVVADDDATTRILVRDALEQDGWVVEEAADGAAACDMVERLEPDVVVSGRRDAQAGRVRGLRTPPDHASL